MSLDITATPIAVGSATKLTIRSLVVDKFDAAPAQQLLFLITERAASDGTVLDVQRYQSTTAALLAATGANIRAKAYALLQTLIGVTGTVT